MTLHLSAYIRRIRLARFLVAVLVSLTSLGAKAQVGEARHNLCLGVSGGVVLNSIGFDPTVKQSQHVGPTVGLVVRYTSERYFKAFCALQVELNYSCLGWKENILNSSSQPLPDTYSRDMHYIQLPMLARLAWGREKRGLMGYVLAGPQIGWCIGETTKASTFTLNSEEKPDRPNNTYEQYSMPVEKKFDYGITAGLGAELTTKAGHFLVEARYYYGLSDIYGNAKKDVFSRSNNGTIYARLTYFIDVKKKGK